MNFLTSDLAKNFNFLSLTHFSLIFFIACIYSMISLFHKILSLSATFSVSVNGSQILTLIYGFSILHFLPPDTFCTLSILSFFLKRESYLNMGNFLSVLSRYMHLRKLFIAIMHFNFLLQYISIKVQL